MKAILKIFVLSAIVFTTHFAVADNKKESKNAEAAQEKELMKTKIQETEHALLEDYFQSQDFSTFEISSDSSIVIYTSEGACVYQGEKSTAKDLINKSAFLFQFDNKEHYVITE